ncbi:hypothetical protein CBS101457_001360 [Exobasidium rhododendri]|nr:hypothetical protein CBS101457_001360 [Exobasidium rhododendri]
MSAATSTNDNGKGKGKETQPLYKDSKAASRPRPNVRSSLFASSISRPKTVGGESRTRGSSAETSSRGENYNVEAALSSAIKTPQAMSDETLSRLYRLLKEKPKNGKDSLFFPIEACREIKKRLRDYHSVDGKMPRPPVFVFLMQLERFATAGQVELCRAVIEDMQQNQVAVNVDILNYVLKAAVVNMDAEEIENILEEIANFNVDPATQRTSDSLKYSLSGGGNSPILSKGWTKNWTVVTYQHLLSFCRHANATSEYALSLLGSASHRLQEGGDEATFLSLVLNRDAVTNLLETFAHAREPRLMLELALWMDNIIGSRRLSAHNWMTILRYCAIEHYFPGIEVAWKEAVVQRFIAPDDGCIVLILVAASRANKTAFIEKVLAFHGARLEKIEASLQEWHLIPLFQSQCADFNFVAALQTAARITKLNPPTLPALMDLRHHASLSEERLEEAYQAMLTVGQDRSHQGGICVSIFNNILLAAERLKSPQMAFKIFRSRHFIRNENSAIDCALPRIEDMKEARSSRDLGEATTTTEQGAIQTVQANIESYNLLLYCALQLEDEELAKNLYLLMNTEKVKADERTYELGIRQALLKTDYQPGFLLLEECKKRKLVPTRSAYLSLAYRCLQMNDPRWIELALELIEIGEGPSAVFYKKLIEGGHQDQITRKNREVYDVKYRREEWDHGYISPTSKFQVDMRTKERAPSKRGSKASQEEW